MTSQVWHEPIMTIKGRVHSEPAIFEEMTAAGN
jgi:hypothetical protein